jgi:mannitol/fructose-specific phosphotransferase system IIA component (Ntr-type)
MHLARVLNDQNIIMHYRPQTKARAIKDLIEASARPSYQLNVIALLQTALVHEQAHTYVFESNGTPDYPASIVHFRSAHVPATILGLGIIDDGILWDFPDQKKIHILAVLAGAYGRDLDTFVWTLGMLIKKLYRHDVRSAILEAVSSDQVIRLLSEDDLDDPCEYDWIKGRAHVTRFVQQTGLSRKAVSGQRDPHGAGRP